MRIWSFGTQNFLQHCFDNLNIYHAPFLYNSRIYALIIATRMTKITVYYFTLHNRNVREVVEIRKVMRETSSYCFSWFGFTTSKRRQQQRAVHYAIDAILSNVLPACTDSMYIHFLAFEIILLPKIILHSVVPITKAFTGSALIIKSH